MFKSLVGRRQLISIGYSTPSWIGVIHLLTATAFTPIFGSLTEIVGRKICFLIAMTSFIIGYLLVGASSSITMVLIGRAFSGTGSGGISATALIIVADLVSLKERGKYQGLLGSMLGFASIAGPLLGGYFVDRLSWRWNFYFPAILGLLPFSLIAFAHNTPIEFAWNQLQNVDFLGCFAILLASSAFVLPLQNGGSVWSWSAPQTITLICLTPFLFSLFLYVESSASSPLIPIELFKNRTVTLILLIQACVGFCFWSLIFFIPSYFQWVMGNTAQLAGTKTIPLWAGVVSLSIGSGLVVTKTGRYKIFFLFSSFLMIVGFSLLSTMSPSTSLGVQIVFLFLTGTGLGCLMQVRVLSIQASVPLNIVPVATAFVST